MLNNIFTIENIFAFCLALAAIYAIIDSRLARRKYSEEKVRSKEEDAKEAGVQEEKMSNIIKSLDHAHDKIRELSDEMNSINTTVIRVQDSIDQLTVIMKKVDLFMDTNLKQITNVDTRLENVERMCHDK
jgi:5-bromo-4-chloroindolyl phosphate hydrolysis protein